ncbi:hypothetical protein chiPu_0015721 [Chiloscyllium punctatum]|uniref:Cyclic AMP-responsive element-binding protein 3-like protein 2 n=1 Tax=Chiloscyllium punctatum TaxID=137246 RepID=A0A401T3M8_CHIPU|nr:hypothetical protein [Chiloscyllium punctatum]
MLDELSKDMLHHLFNDPFLSDKSELMDAELSPAPHIQAEHSYSLAGDSRPQSPLTQISTEEDFSEDMECESWSVGSDLKPITLKHEALLCDSNCLAPSVTLTTATTSVGDVVLETYKMDTASVTESGLDAIPDGETKTCTSKLVPKIKLEPHEVDQFLNLAPKEVGGISAQESRRKKKEYMDTLEKKVESCSNENSELRRKVENLEKANRSLLQQLQGLQVLVAGKVPRPCKMASTQTSTCLMIVVLCFAIALGSFSNRFDPFSSSVTKSVLPVQDSTQESYAATVRSRHLLFYEEHPGFEDEISSVMSTDAWEKLAESVRERARLAQLLTARGSAQKQQVQEAVTHSEEPAEEYIISNETRTENSVLIELQSQRSLPSVGMNGTTVEIDRRVNTTS